MEFMKQLEVIEIMSRAAIKGKEWPFKVDDLEAANQLLETTIRLMGAALGNFDVTDDLQMLDAQRKALTLIELSLSTQPDQNIVKMLPDTLSESRTVNQFLARYAAHWLNVASNNTPELSIRYLRRRITETELNLSPEGASLND